MEPEALRERNNRDPRVLSIQLNGVYRISIYAGVRGPMENRNTKSEIRTPASALAYASRVAKYAVSYIAFFWGVSWRSLVLSLLMAVIMGVCLGIMVNKGVITPESMEPLATMIASPMTLAIVIGVIFIRVRDVTV